MKKGLSLWFNDKKFGKEFVLERFTIHIEVMCGVIRGGKGFTSRNQTSACVKGYVRFMFLDKGACQHQESHHCQCGGKRQGGIGCKDFNLFVCLWEVCGVIVVDLFFFFFATVQQQQ